MSEERTVKRNPLPSIIALILGVLATVLVFQNTQVVHINLWIWNVEASLIIVMGAMFLLGILVVLLPMSSKLFKKNRQLKRCRKELKKKEEEIAEIKKKQEMPALNKNQEPNTN